MAQVVSRSKLLNDVGWLDKNKSKNNWNRSLLVLFHGTAASIYGYSICWQSVSNDTNTSMLQPKAASAQLYARTNPAVRVYGRWRFLTYNCLVMQFVAYSLCLASHFVPRLRKSKDFFFTTFAFPIGVMVVSTFWAVWFSVGREYIFPLSLEPYYPVWLNHVTHTIIFPINMLELLAVKHQYFSDKKSVTSLTAYVLTYTSYLLYIKYQTGRFVYPFLNKMDTLPVAAFIVGMSVFTVLFYKSGKLIHNCYHGLKSSTTSKVDKKTDKQVKQQATRNEVNATELNRFENKSHIKKRQLA